MSVTVKNRNGQNVTLYNPAEKGEIAAFELKNNYNARTGETRNSVSIPETASATSPFR